LPCSILVVEDSEDLRDATRALLEEHGNRVSCASNGREALGWLLANEPPCLILLDLSMPEMSGWELAEIMARHPTLSGIPVVIMTASTSASGATLRATAFLRKPFSVDALVGATQHCLRHAGIERATE
jgi:CheY-like chemotaxis protein